MSKIRLPHDDPSLPSTWRGKRIGERESGTRASPSLLTIFRARGSFSSVDDATIEQLEQHLQPLAFADAEIISREGTPAEWTFVITKGEVEVVKLARNGAFILVNVLQPGDWGGIMGLLSPGPRTARLLARGDVTVLAIDHKSLVKLMGDLPGISAGLLGCMGQRIRDDASHLMTTLQHVRAVGLDDVAEHCSPHERLMLDTIRYRVAAAESLSQIMDFVFDSIPHEDDARMTLAFLEDEDAGGRVVSQWSRATYQPLLLPPTHGEDLVGSLMEESYRSSQPSIVNDLEKFACNHPFNQGAVRRVKEGLRSSMISPLRVGGRTAGFLVRSVRTLNAFDEHQMLVLQAIADSIGPVVGKAYRIEMLTKANNDYAEVLSFISHELQSPVASMVTDARLMEAGYLGSLNEKQKEKIGRTIRKGEYLLTMIREFLNLARLEEGSLKAHMAKDIDLNAQVVMPSLDLLESDFEAMRMVVRCDVEADLPTVDCDIGLLQIAVSNLLRNTITYGREGGTVRVTLERERGIVESINIKVWNAGPGFSESQRSQLFRKFSRLEGPELTKKKGTGIGLYSTWRIMQLHHGRASARSQQGQWAEFKLTLPLRQQATGGVNQTQTD